LAKKYESFSAMPWFPDFSQQSAGHSPDCKSNGMNRKFSRIIGLSLIVFSWILWGVIFVLPFFKLTLTQYAIVYPVILGATNIFWVGAALVGKELIQKFNLMSKVKTWYRRCNMRKKS
jgi:hypothetical protein